MFIYLEVHDLVYVKYLKWLSVVAVAFSQATQN